MGLMPEGSLMAKRRISRMLFVRKMTMKRTTRTRKMRKTRTTMTKMRMRRRMMTKRMRRYQAHLIKVRDILIGKTWRFT